MRISDWSSDVCSSDLTSAQGSSPSGGETSEPLRRAEPDDARVEREDVGAEQGVVAVGEGVGDGCLVEDIRSEEHTSELQSLMRISYAVFCLKKKKRRENCENDKVVADNTPNIHYNSQ